MIWSENIEKLTVFLAQTLVKSAWAALLVQ